MKCQTIIKTKETTCDVLDGIHYCREVYHEEKICVPTGKDALERLNMIISGLKKGFGRFIKGETR